MEEIASIWGYFSLAVCFLLPTLLVTIPVVVAVSQGAWWHYGIFGWRRLFPDNSASPQPDLRAHRETWAEPCNPTESSHKAGVVKRQTQHLPLRGWGHTGLLRSCLCLSCLINSEITVKFLFPSFLHLCSLQSGLPETRCPKSDRWDLSVLAAVLTPLPALVPPTSYTIWDTPPSPFLPLTYSKYPLVSLLF